MKRSVKLEIMASRSIRTTITSVICRCRGHPNGRPPLGSQSADPGVASPVVASDRVEIPKGARPHREAICEARATYPSLARRVL
jgi:hypothetical protein